MTNRQKPDQKLTASVLLSRPRDGDYVMLSDAVLLAALDSSRPLNAAQRTALQQSPLTLRRFRHLALQARAQQAAKSTSSTSSITPPTPTMRAAANDPSWHGSSGMLRAADSGAALTALPTDDGYWVLHFVAADAGWQVILALDAAAPFAARLLHENSLLQVVDGAGAVILQGHLDADGESEARWPFALAPAAHFQQCGAVFTVRPL